MLKTLILGLLIISPIYSHGDTIEVEEERNEIKRERGIHM